MVASYGKLWLLQNKLLQRFSFFDESEKEKEQTLLDKESQKKRYFLNT